MMTNESIVAIGLDAQAFFNTQLGEYILNRHEEEIKRALEQLAVVDPEDVKTIMALQRDAQAPADAIRWLATAIQEGDVARASWEEEESNG